MVHESANEQRKCVLTQTFRLVTDGWSPSPAHSMSANYPSGPVLRVSSAHCASGKVCF